jgi:hypothetical protein
MSGCGAETEVLLLGGHNHLEISEAKVIREFGDVPDDLSVL